MEICFSVVQRTGEACGSLIGGVCGPDGGGRYGQLEAATGNPASARESVSPSEVEHERNFLDSLLSWQSGEANIDSVTFWEPGLSQGVSATGITTTRGCDRPARANPNGPERSETARS